MSSSTCICVECGEAVDSLYTEFAKGNIKLTRCPRCSSVADKYIEFELTLVVLDMTLHRKQAYRHLLFNRSTANMEHVPTIARWIFITVLLVNCCLKYILLHDRIYSDMATKWILIHLFVTAVVEHVFFVASVAYILRRHREFQPFISGQIRLRNKFYFALCLSNYFKFYAITLQIFGSGSEPYVLILVGIFLMSIEILSLQSLFNTSYYSKILVAIGVGTLLRVVVRTFFYNLDDIYHLGVHL